MSPARAGARRLRANEFNPLVDRYLNRAAFLEPVGELGNAADQWRCATAVEAGKHQHGETIALSSGLRLDVRAEAFNIFNRAIRGGPGENFNNSRFGQVTLQGTLRARCSLGWSCTGSHQHIANNGRSATMTPIRRCEAPYRIERCCSASRHQPGRPLCFTRTGLSQRRVSERRDGLQSVPHWHLAGR
jgi:hypothetical protein